MPKVRIGVLISGSGTNLQSIIDNIESGYINGEIAVVISDRKDAYGLKRAQNHGIEAVFIDRANYDTGEEFSEAILEVLKNKNVELVVLAGFLRILGRKFVKEYEGRLINIHPSLIPAFCGKGFYGERVHKAVIEYGVKYSGVTVHFVDEGADTGPIILQKIVEVLENDTPETLAKRVLEIEHKLLPEAVKLYCEGRLQLEGRKVRIKPY